MMRKANVNNMEKFYVPGLLILHDDFLKLKSIFN